MRETVGANAKMNIKKVLDQQFEIIYRTDRCLNFLLDYQIETQKIGSQPKELSFLYIVLRDYIITQLYKLLNSPREDYSFQNLLLCSNDLIDKKIAQRRLSSITKEYKRLGINRIRVQHVGHLDADRKKEELNWEEVKKLNDDCKDFHDYMNYVIYQTTTYWELETNPLNVFYKNTLAIYKLLELIRPFGSSEDTINKEIIGKILKN